MVSLSIQKPVQKPLHSQYWDFIWEWRFHSRTAAMGFPLRDEITDGYKETIAFIEKENRKIHFRQEANHIYSHSEWNWYCGSF